MPQRIQRKRAPGWRLPENTVIVDRTSRFGNPFTVADAIEAGYENPVRACVSHHAAWIEGSPDYDDVYVVNGRVFDRRWIRKHLHELAGKNVCCPCSLDGPCHADNYLRRANGGAA